MSQVSSEKPGRIAETAYVAQSYFLQGVMFGGSLLESVRASREQRRLVSAEHKAAHQNLEIACASRLGFPDEAARVPIKNGTLRMEPASGDFPMFFEMTTFGDVDAHGDRHGVSIMLTPGETAENVMATPVVRVNEQETFMAGDSAMDNAGFRWHREQAQPLSLEQMDSLAAAISA